MTISLEGLLREGVSKFNGGRPEASILDFTKAAALEPSNPRPYFFRAMAYRELGQEGRARRDMRRATKLGSIPLSPRAQRAAESPSPLGSGPPSPDVWLRRAQAALREGGPRTAQPVISRGLGLSPNSPELWAARAEISKALGRKAEAISAARRAALLAPASAEIRVKRIALLWELGDSGAAFAECAAALKRVSKKWGVLQMLASLQMREGRCQDAEKTLRRALACVKKAIAAGGEAREAAFLELAAAEIYEDLADLDLSAAHLKRAVGLDPENVLGLAKLAQMSVWRGHFNEALRQAAKALSIDSSYAIALRVKRAAAAFRGISWARGPRDRRWEPIEREFQLEPRCAPLRLRVGRLLLRYGHAREALSCFEGAMRMDPGSREARKGKASALRRLGRSAVLAGR